MKAKSHLGWMVLCLVAVFTLATVSTGTCAPPKWDRSADVVVVGADIIVFGRIAGANAAAEK